jgi:thioredoxin-like negative regulator of GroEL
MRYRVAIVSLVVALQGWLVSSAFAQVQNQNRLPATFGIAGRIIVPLADFQDIFEVILVQNLEQPVQATVADSQGRYRFSGLARGTYYITVKLEGFQEVRQRVDLSSDTIVNIILDFQEERVVKPPTDFSGEQTEVVDISDLSKNYPSPVIEKLKAVNKDIQIGNYAKALPVLEEIVRDAPDLYQAHRALGMIYQKQARYRDAESEYRTAADLRQNSAAPWINLGSLFVEEADASASQGSAVVRGILNEALGSLNSAVKLKPDASFAYYLLGVTYYKSAFYEDAEEHLKHALELTPDLFDARLALANVYIRMQEWPNVITQLDAYLVANPKSPMRDQIQAMRSRVVARSQAKLR